MLPLKAHGSRYFRIQEYIEELDGGVVHIEVETRQ
jgi:hypothetical protein